MPTTLKNLLEAGVHFGHQTRRWNPKMKRYIFLERNGIYIIDLQKTLRAITTAEELVRGAVARGGKVLFIGTKPQAKDTIREEAERSGMPWVTERWLGGTLTNFQTVRRSLRRLEELEMIESGGGPAVRSKKESLQLRKEAARLQKVFGGIRTLEGLPSVLFVVDTRKEKIAVAEANRLRIPVVGMVDTNSDPDAVTIPIPANDDAIRSIRLVTRVLSDAAIEARKGQHAAEAAEAPAAAEQPVGVEAGTGEAESPPPVS
jgi:small subunit ribosomal protein S2